MVVSTVVQAPIGAQTLVPEKSAQHGVDAARRGAEEHSTREREKGAGNQVEAENVPR